MYLKSYADRQRERSTDEDFAVMVFQKNLTSQIDEIVKDAETFDIDALKRMYYNGLDRFYNAIIILHRMIYDGPIKEVQNETFGYFKFLVCLIAGNDFRQLSMYAQIYQRRYSF